MYTRQTKGIHTRGYSESATVITILGQLLVVDGRQALSHQLLTVWSADRAAVLAPFAGSAEFSNLRGSIGSSYEPLFSIFRVWLWLCPEASHGSQHRLLPPFGRSGCHRTGAGEAVSRHLVTTTSTPTHSHHSFTRCRDLKLCQTQTHR